MRALVTLLAVCEIGCTRFIELPDSAPKNRVVRTVYVTGNQALGDAELRDGLATHAPEGLWKVKHNDLSDSSIDADKKRLLHVFQRGGFFSAEVTRVEVRPVRKQYADVVFHVKEGKPTAVASVAISGAPPDTPKSEEILFELFTKQIGERYRQSRYESAKGKVAKQLAAWGYAHANVRGQVIVDRVDRSARIRVTVDAGPKVRIGKTTIKGLGYMPREPVLLRIPWKQGDLYTPAITEQARTQLLALGRFSSVFIDFDRSDRTAIANPVVSVRETKRNELRVGAGGFADNTQVAPTFRLGFVRRGIFGAANSFRFDLRARWPFQPPFLDTDEGVEDPQGEAIATFERLDFPAPFFVSSLLGGYEFDEIRAYQIEGPRVRVGTLPSFLGSRISLRLAWQLRWAQYQDIDPGLPSGGAEPNRESLGIVDGQVDRVGTFEQALVFDWRNDVIAPTYGWYAELVAEQGTIAAGGEFDYVRITPEVRGYVPLMGLLRGRLGRGKPRVVLAAKVRVGAGLGISQLPAVRRYFSGGASRHRGFAARTLAPTVIGVDENGDSTGGIAVGGDAMIESSLDLRLRVWGPLGAAIFVDAGDATFSVGDLDPFDLHTAVGMGIRAYTPVGPIRFDVGRRLNRLGTGEPRAGDKWAFHLSFGEAF